MIGNVISSYKIMAKLGEGAMGTVYKGLDYMLEREVAVKVLRPELGRHPDLVERFRTEAVTLARLQHANIATLYIFMREGDDYFMVMEYVPGETLDALLRRPGALPSQQAVAIFGQALEGIGYAHKMGVIHRDIKPGNVMLTPMGSVKVMDFGIARALNSTQRLTREGRVVGTVEYMSPEQVRGEATDARSDIYSAGVMLYEMLTGRVPFSSTSEFAIMQAHVSSMPLPLRELVPGIPPVVEQVVLRALAKAPEQRFQTAEDFRSALLGMAPAPNVTFSTQPLVSMPATLPMMAQGNDQSPAGSPTGTPTVPMPGPQMNPNFGEDLYMSGGATTVPTPGPQTPGSPMPGPPVKEIKETRMAVGDPSPWPACSMPAAPIPAGPIPPGNPNLQPVVWPARIGNEESHLRRYWKYYAAGGATVLVLSSIIGLVVVISALRQSKSAPDPAVTPQPAVVIPDQIADPQWTPEPTPPNIQNSEESSVPIVDQRDEQPHPRPTPKPPRKKTPAKNMGRPDYNN